MPAGAAPGSYPITITGTTARRAPRPAGHARHRRPGRQRHRADRRLPVAAGRSGERLHVQPDDHQQHAGGADVHVRSDGPAGLDGDRVADRRGAGPTVTIDAGATGTVKVTATPPATAEEGSYPIEVAVTAANGATGQIELTAEVTGTPQARAGDGRPATRLSGHAEQREASADDRRPTPARRRSRTSSSPAPRRPAGRSRSTRRRSPACKPNETAQVTAIIKPSSDAVAGDYAITVRSSAGSQSSNIDLRFALKGRARSASSPSS